MRHDNHKWSVVAHHVVVVDLSQDWLEEGKNKEGVQETADYLQNRVHPHVHSAYTDQDTPAESHTEAQEERILPPSVGQHEETEREGCARHGVRGGHTVFGVVEDLHLYHRGRGRSGPPDHVLGGLSHEQVPGPDHDESPADQGVDVPEEEREEGDEEHLVAQLSAKGEQIKQKLVVDQELLTGIPSQ